MIQGLHHFAIIVSSEKSVTFYANLGFHENKRIIRKNDTVVLMRGYGIQLELFIDSSHPKKAAPEPMGLRHFALKVDCIEKTVDSLGLDIGPIMMDWTGNRYAYCSDPDGLVIEIRE